MPSCDFGKPCDCKECRECPNCKKNREPITGIDRKGQRFISFKCPCEDAVKILTEVGVLEKKPDGRKGRVFRKKRGKIEANQKKDLIKDIRGLLRLEWDSDKIDLEKLNKIKTILETKEEE